MVIMLCTLCCSSHQRAPSICRSAASASAGTRLSSGWAFGARCSSSSPCASTVSGPGRAGRFFILCLAAAACIQVGKMHCSYFSVCVFSIVGAGVMLLIGDNSKGKRKQALYSHGICAMET